MDQSVILSACGLNLYYGENHALKDISIDIKANKITALIGPSGCGKSTFLRTIDRMNDLIPSVKITGSPPSTGRRSTPPAWTSPTCAGASAWCSRSPTPFPCLSTTTWPTAPAPMGSRQAGLGRAGGEVPASGRHLGRGEGPAEKARPGPVWRPAAAPVHRPGPGGPTGGAADGRGHLRPGPHLYLQNRRPCHGAEKASTLSSW